MKLKAIKFSKKKLLSIPEHQRAFFVLIGTQLNELAILQKLMLYSTNKPDKETAVEKQVRNAQSFFISTMLAGKLFECWDILSKKFVDKDLDKIYGRKLNAETIEHLQTLKDFFSDKDNFIEKVRKKHAFHYDLEEMKKIFEKLPDDDYEIFLHEYTGNCFYYFSNYIQGTSIADSISSDPHEALNTYFSKIIEISKLLQNVLQHIFIVILEKYFNKNFEEIEISEPPSLNDIHLPFFLKK